MKLREVYHKLRAEHITLLRTNGENQKKVQTMEKAQQEVDEQRKVSNDVMSSIVCG